MVPPMTAILVAIGSALGGATRYGVTVWAARIWGETFPWGTLVINILGSFVIGVFFNLTMADGPLPESANIRLFVMSGLCGGFTTFSAFSLQALLLLRDGEWLPALAYMVGSVVLCLAAVLLGHWLAGRIGIALTAWS
jgi:CrcB protein